MSFYYDYDGNPVTLEEWGELWKKDRKINNTVLDKSSGWNGMKMQVSSVWIGLSWGSEFENERPLVYETMVFCLDDPERWDDLGCWRWATREETLAGHERIVQEILSGELVLALSERD